MSASANHASAPVSERATPLRLWPYVLIVLAQIVLLILPPVVLPGRMVGFLAMMIGPLACFVLFAVWWLFFSRASWKEALVTLLVFLASAAMMVPLIDPSLLFGIYTYGLPVSLIVLLIGLGLTRRASRSTRMKAIIPLILCSWAAWTLLRLDGVHGHGAPEFSWRFSPTAEEQFLAERNQADAPIPVSLEPGQLTEPLTLQPGDWPEFRGPQRDSRVPGVTLARDWSAQPPKELWRQPVGPGWGSMTVVDGRLFTQEQRGENEAVVCYDAATGNEVWVHNDKTRFYEALAGAGPRATPTFVEGRIYTLGANGTLNCLEATTGRRVWNRDLVKDTGAPVPMWGFSSSPLIQGDVAIVYAGGPGDKDLVAYDRETGDIRWTANAGEMSYSSPQAFTLAGQSQALMLTDAGLLSVDPENGKTLWEADWSVGNAARIVQPHQLGENQLLISTGDGQGTRCFEVRREGEQWIAEQKWASRDLSPYYNDYVSYDGHLYGFDNNIFVCVDAATGKKKWKRGRYGYGQVLLLADAGQLLVLSEEPAELVLLAADPAEHREFARLTALPGKTWNHPVIAGDRLYIRNGEEMACYELPLVQPDAQVALANP